jgi:hypothetical protein
MQKKVFGESYKLYQQIVTGYKQVQGQIKPAAQNTNTQQEQKPAGTPQPETPAGTNANAGGDTANKPV